MTAQESGEKDVAAAADAGALDWEAVIAASSTPPSDPVREDRRELVGLRLGPDAYAVPIEAVREIVRLRPITPIPRAPEAVRGVLSLRGEMIQVVDLRRRLGLGSVETGRFTRILVLQRDDGSLTGLLVDQVRDVVRTCEAELLPPPPGDGDAVLALAVRDGTFVSVLDLDRVLDLDHGRA